jgi:hypothetical protein
MIGRHNPNIGAHPTVILHPSERTGFSENTHFRRAFLLRRARRPKRTGGYEADSAFRWSD